MLTVVLPTDLETAVTAAAHRTGQTLNEYMTGVCADAISLEIDRARVDAYLDGLPGIPHERARTWLAELAEGKKAVCPV